MAAPSLEEMEVYLGAELRQDRAVNEAWCALRAAVLARHALYEQASPRNGRICAIARKLYEHRHGTDGGDDPVITLTPCVTGNGGTAIRGPFAPAWATYCGDATEFLMISERLPDA